MDGTENPSIVLLMPITLKQIADYAGVSRQTVSYILNTKAHLFLPETRERVLRACDDLGYRPNAGAKALRSGRFGSIGLVSSSEYFEGRISPFALRAIQETLEEQDMHLVTGFFRQTNVPGDFPKLLRELCSDGLIVNYGMRVPSHLEAALRESRFPMVWMNRIRSRDAVYPDDRSAGRMAAQHLMALGHERIAWVNLVHSRDSMEDGQLHYSFGDRVAGYEDAMRDAGLRPWSILKNPNVSGHDSVAGPFPWLEDRRRPTGIILNSCESGLGPLLYQCGRLGLSIPRDLSVLVVTDGEEPGYGQPLDFIEIPHAEMGRRVVSMLLKKIASPGTSLKALKLAPVYHARGTSSGPKRKA